MILDNCAAHKHPKVIEWLTRHPRFVFHFTPTSASWLNAVEGFFAILAKRRLKRGVFRSVVDLQAAITGAGGFTKNGAATLLLQNNNNSFSGTVMVNDVLSCFSISRSG